MSFPTYSLCSKYWGPLRGDTCSLVPQKKLEFFPRSPKINQDVPWNSLSSSSLVPRNYVACSLDPQKYYLMFLTVILIIFQFLMVSCSHKFYLVSHSSDNLQQNASSVSLLNVASPQVHQQKFLLPLLEWGRHSSLEFYPDVESALPL